MSGKYTKIENTAILEARLCKCAHLQKFYIFARFTYYDQEDY